MVLSTTARRANLLWCCEGLNPILPINPTANPQPYKTMTAALNKAQKENSKGKNMYFFPDDDWHLSQERQAFRTVDLPIPRVVQSGGEDVVPPELRQCATSYVCDTFTVERKYAAFTQV